MLTCLFRGSMGIPTLLSLSFVALPIKLYGIDSGGLRAVYVRCKSASTRCLRLLGWMGGMDFTSVSSHCYRRSLGSCPRLLVPCFLDGHSGGASEGKERRRFPWISLKARQKQKEWRKACWQQQWVLDDLGLAGQPFYVS